MCVYIFHCIICCLTSVCYISRSASLLATHLMFLFPSFIGILLHLILSTCLFQFCVHVLFTAKLIVMQPSDAVFFPHA